MDPQQMTTPERIGVEIRFFPGRLSAEDLDSLTGWPNTGLASYAPRLFGWLAKIGAAERDRRLLVDLAADGIAEANPPDMEFPLLDIHKWSPSDVADALEISAVMTYTLRRPVLGEFLDKVAQAVVVFTGQILRRHTQ